MPDKRRYMPNGDYIDFPDDMSDADIQQQMNKFMGQASQQQQTAPEPQQAPPWTEQPLRQSMQQSAQNPDAWRKIWTALAGLPQNFDWYGPQTQLVPPSESEQQLQQLGIPYQPSTGQAIVRRTMGLLPYSGYGQAVQQSIGRMQQPGLANKAAGATEFLLSGLPYGPGVAGLMEEATQPGHLPHALAGAVPAGVTMAGMPETTRAAVESPAVKGTARWLAAISDPAIQGMKERFQKQQDARTQAYNALQMRDVGGQTTSYLQEQAKQQADYQDDLAKHAQRVASAKQEISDIQQHNTQVQQNQVRGQQVTAQLPQHGQALLDLDATEEAAARAAFPETAAILQPEPILDAIKESRAALHGSTNESSVVEGIRNEIQPPIKTQTSAQQLLDVQANKYEGLARHSIEKEGKTAQETREALEVLGIPKDVARRAVELVTGQRLSQLTFDNQWLQAKIGDLGRAAIRATDPLQEAQLWDLRTRFQKLQDGLYPEQARQQLQAARDGYTDYMNTFANPKRGSPLAVLLSKKNPALTEQLFRSDIEALISNETNYRDMQQLLADYGTPGAQQFSQRMAQAKADYDTGQTRGQVKNLSPELVARANEPAPPPPAGPAPRAPSTPYNPKLPPWSVSPDAPTLQFDPAEARRQILMGRKPVEATGGTFWMANLRRSVARALAQQPWLREWLTRGYQYAPWQSSPALRPPWWGKVPTYPPSNIPNP